MQMVATPTFAIIDRLISRCIMHMFFITVRSGCNEGWLVNGLRKVERKEKGEVRD
jgi:antibiotic biosynthesis monooxygenase (ABM) superfamily enzyme